MAKEPAKKDDKDIAEAGAAAAPRSGKKKLILLGGIALLLVIIAIAAAMLLLRGKPEGDAEGEDEVAEETQSKPQKPPVFVNLETFTVNLQGGEQFLQAVVTLKVSSDKVTEQIRQYMPQVRHEMLAILSSKNGSEVVSPDGREALAEELRDAVNELLGYKPPKQGGRKKKAEGEGELPVDSVYFTQFIVQ